MRGKSKTGRTRRTDGMKAIEAAYAEAAGNDGAEPYDLKYIPVLADTNPALYAQRQAVINTDVLWPSRIDMNKAWDNATIQVRLHISIENGMQEFIGRKSQGRKPNQAGSQQEIREFGKSGRGRDRHLAQKSADKAEAREALSGYSTKLKL